ncbi:hypothetical protein [Xylanimonas ulmi]|uniref:hypothetical protein n=1 Tax=Xylanimonas ulmi TaxID=228973 RepID=UPI0013EEB526|nr:hypothetical protein [Xylanibacterium ulmi]
MPDLDFGWLDGVGTPTAGTALRDIAGTVLGVGILLCAIAFIIGVAGWVAAHASGGTFGGKRTSLFAGGAGAALLAMVLLGSLAGATGWGAGTVGEWTTTFLPLGG